MSETTVETCWHCGELIDARPRPRCQLCPDECDVEDCEEFGCAEPAPTDKQAPGAEVARQAMFARAEDARLHGGAVEAHAYREAARLVESALRGEP